MSQLKMVSPFLTTNSSACTHDPFRGVRVFPVRFLHPYLSSKLTSHPLISVHSRRFSGSLLSSAQCPLSSIMGISHMGCSQKVGGRDMCSAKFAGITVPMLSAENQLVHDIVMSVLTASVALALLRFWDEMAKRNIFHPTLNRKFVHISIGLVFLLFWPLFSTGPQAPYLAALAPGVNIFRMIGLGLGILKNEAMVKSMSRHGNARELLKGPLYYACTLTFVTILFWRTSPIGPVAIANLCAGDGCADIAGRRLGTIKLPYNKNKSFAGSFTMLIMGSTASIGYLFYFAFFGYYDVNLKMLLAALLVSIAATLTESLPISTELDDNLTVSLVSAVVGCLVF